MREKLNENPVAQIAVIGVLALVVAVFALKSLGGESSEGEPAAGAEAPAAGLEGSTPAASAASVSAPTARTLPDDLEAAYARGDTVVLLIYRPGSIEDRRVAATAGVLDEMPGVALFRAPAGEISRYAPITGPLGVNQTPALIVISPRSQNGDGAAPATVTYGFQNAQDLRQAVVDAGYQGPQLPYAPK
jgi:hypothetical protein